MSTHVTAQTSTSIEQDPSGSVYGVIEKSHKIVKYTKSTLIVKYTRTVYEEYQIATRRKWDAVQKTSDDNETVSDVFEVIAKWVRRCVTCMGTVWKGR